MVLIISVVSLGALLEEIQLSYPRYLIPNSASKCSPSKQKVVSLIKTFWQCPVQHPSVRILRIGEVQQLVDKDFKFQLTFAVQLLIQLRRSRASAKDPVSK